MPKKIGDHRARLIKKEHCRISYGGGLGTSPCIMGLVTQRPIYSERAHQALQNP